MRSVPIQRRDFVAAYRPAPSCGVFDKSLCGCTTTTETPSRSGIALRRSLVLHQAFDRLARDLGDQIEILVVVEDGQT